MRCCLNMRSHANARVAAIQMRQSLLKTGAQIIRRDDIPSNELPLRHDVLPFSTAGKADIVIKNASFSGETKKGKFGVAISSNTIVFAGDTEKAESFIADSTEVVDACGRTVLPGFCDSHVHLMVAAERFQGISVETVRTPNEFKKIVSDFIARNPNVPIVHVYGLHYVDPPIIPAATTRQFLDKILSDRPVFVYAHDLHTGWANSKALEMGDLPPQMPPYPQLVEELNLEKNIELDSQGAPTGELREPNAYFLVEGVLRQKYPLNLEQKLEYLKRALHKLASLGVTSIHNMGLALPEEDIELLLLLLELEQQGELPVRVHCNYSIIPDEHMLSDIYYAARIRDQIRQAREGHISSVELHKFLVETLQYVAKIRHKGCLNLEKLHPQLNGHKHLPFIHEVSHRIDTHIHHFHVYPHVKRLIKRLESLKDHQLDSIGMFELGGVKIFMDGVIEKDTAFRLAKPPKPGIPAYNQEQLDLLVTESDRAGLQVAAHCIGDGSVKSVLNAVAVARKQNAGIDANRGHRIRHRIEHVELCPPNDIETFFKLDVTPSMQPLHERPPVTMWHEKVSKEMWRYAFPWQDLLKTGSRLAFGSDWPIVSCNCLEGMRRAVTRCPWAPGLPNEKLSEEQVVDAFSTHSAYLEYREEMKGKVKEGMLADLVVLSDNLLEVDKNHLDHVKVVHSFCNGKSTFKHSQQT